MIDAAEYLSEHGLCQPVFLKPASTPIPGAEIFSQQTDMNEWIDKVIQQQAANLAKYGLSKQEFSEQLSHDQLMLATALVSTGYADSGVAGAVASSADVLKACLRSIGLAEGTELVSSTFLIDHPHRLMTYADCAVNPCPDESQLAQIAIDSAATHQTLCDEEANVALLSFSTMGSAVHPAVDKVKRALDIVVQRAPHLNVAGELQADAALVPEVAVRKVPDSPLAGHANVLIFPDLNSGNIAYKMTERLGNAQAVGPILQGLKKPWIDLSRGCSTSDIVNAAVIASVLSATDL